MKEKQPFHPTSRWFPLLLLVMTGTHMTATGQSERQVRQFVNQQLSQYPKLHLQDLYKSCYQDFMGPEHLIPNSDAARSYLQQELDDLSPSFDSQWLRYEACGTHGDHVRINLQCVKTGYVTADSLNSWFVQSANTARKHTLDDWIRHWTKIERFIDNMDLHLPDYEREKAFIQSMFAKGEYACSHSSDYRENYSPHYRIISKKIFRRNKKSIPMKAKKRRRNRIY